MKLFNINKEVTVKLTKHGRSILLAKDHIQGKLSTGWIYRVQLWCLMNEFGEHLFNGGEVLFEGNCINLGEDNE